MELETRLIVRGRQSRLALRDAAHDEVIALLEYPHGYSG